MKTVDAISLIESKFHEVILLLIEVVQERFSWIINQNINEDKKAFSKIIGPMLDH